MIFFGILTYFNLVRQTEVMFSFKECPNLKKKIKQEIKRKEKISELKEPNQKKKKIVT